MIDQAKTERETEREGGSEREGGTMSEALLTPPSGIAHSFSKQRFQ